MGIEDKSAAEGLREVQSALDGKLALSDLRPIDVAKMARIMLSPQDADVRVDVNGFFVRYPGRSREFQYYPALAGPSIDCLLAATDLERPIREPQRGTLSFASLPPSSMFRTVERSPRTLWVVPGPVEVRLHLREGIHLVCRDLEPWKPRAKVWVELVHPIPCDHCGARSKHFREVERSFICQACGRSFLNTVRPEDIVRKEERAG